MPQVHASCIAWDGQGLLIRGASGSGKSSLALELMALGARLVADDRVDLTVSGAALVARCPDPLSGLIEARGIGILNARPFGPVALSTVVDLDTEETMRLPPRRTVTLEGVSLALFYKVSTPSFAAALAHYLRGGRHA